MHFTVTGIPVGSTVTVTITLPAAIGACYLQTGSAYLESPDVQVAGRVVTVTVTDGGTADQDTVANGAVTSSALAAVPTEAAAMPAFTA